MAAFCAVLPEVAAGMKAPGSTMRRVIIPEKGANHQVRGFLLRFVQAFVVDGGDLDFSPVSGALGEQLRNFDLGQKSAFLHLLALVHGDSFQVAANLGIEGGLLVGLDFAGQRDVANDRTPLGLGSLHYDWRDWCLCRFGRGGFTAGKDCLSHHCHTKEHQPRWIMFHLQIGQSRLGSVLRLLSLRSNAFLIVGIQRC